MDSTSPTQVRALQQRVAELERLYNDALADRGDAIHQARQVEEQLARLAAIVRSSQDAIIGVTLDGIVTSWNTGAERLYGYLSDEAIGEPISMVVPPDRSAEVLLLLGRIKHGERVEHFDTIRRRKDGTPVEVSLTLSPIIEPSGRMIGVSAIARDITERRQNEEAIRKSEELYRTLVENVGLGISLIDGDHNIVMVNSMLSRHFQEPVEAFVGGKCYERLQKRTDICPECPGGRSMKTGAPTETTKECIRADGSRFPVLLKAFPLLDKNGEALGFIEVGEDLTDRQEAEKAIRQSEEQYRHIFEAVTEGLLILDFDGAVVEANPAACATYGYPRHELIGLAGKRLVHPDYHHAFEEFRQRIIAGDRFEDEAVCIRKDGSAFHVEVRGGPFSLRGEPHLLAVVRDITEHKLAEQAMQNYAAVLEASNKALEAAHAAAEAATRAKSAFLANMSHEIRTPMTAILGFAEVLLGSPQQPGQIEAAQTIKRNGEHLLTLINDILDLSKIEAGKLAIEPTPCSPVAIVTEVVSLMQVRAAAKNLPLDVEYQGPIPDVIHSDPVRLRQILINLIGNALKFTEVGSVRVAITLLEGDDSPRIRFDVTDTGIGMTQEQMARLFVPFTQADVSTLRQYGGTGLGLTISKRLTEMLGGSLSVQSTVGKGSTFSVTIDPGPLDGVRMVPCPAKTAAKAESVDISCHGPEVKLHCRLLLVEDGPDNQRLIAFLLRKAGAEVDVAENGQVAVERVLGCFEDGKTVGGFDVILMDIQMPVMDGYEATKRIRQAGYRGPILALTAHAMKEDQQRCLEAGCDAYLSKPIDRATLLATVAQFIASEQRT
jgi:PAS domain S-box-containing protein